VRVILKIILALFLLLLLLIAGMLLLRPLEPPLELREPEGSARRVEEPGVYGNFFPVTNATGDRQPGVLLLGGSEGGLGSGAYAMAAGLQARGYNVLQLAFYRAPGQPRDLVRVPLETFDAGLEWLRGRPEVDRGRLALVGVSKGAEAGLILATRQPIFEAIVLGVPSSVSWAGINWALGGTGFRSSWSLRGEPWPYLPYGAFDRDRGVVSVYENGLEKLAEHPDAVIPVERAGAPMLLVCGEQDTLWPSCPMAQAIAERSASQTGPAVRVLAFADAGHAAVGVPRADGDGSLESLAAYGGSGEGNNAARRESWQATLDFLAERLGKAEP